MARYFFDLLSGDDVALDDEGAELPDAEAAHIEAVGSLVDEVRDLVLQGQADQRFVLQVRDELGPVLEVIAVIESRILRRQ